MENSNQPAVLVTAVGAPPGLNALRALVESGKYRLIAADADPRSAGLHQFGVPRVTLPTATADSDAYLEALCEVIRQHQVNVVLPCIEEEVGLLAERQAVIEETGARVLLPDGPTVARAASKYTSTEASQRLGIACPKTILIRERTVDLESLVNFAELCPPPWIGKPVIGHGMKGVLTLDSLEHARSHLAAHSGEMLVQEKIPGPIGSMHLVGLVYDRNGKVVRRFCSRSIRTLFSEGGPATAGVSLDNEQLVQQTINLIDSIGSWRGPINAEWMLDPRDQQFKFIEINPRLWGYGYLATGAGTNFPVTTVELALGRDVGPDPGYRAGVTMLRTSLDLIFPECPFDLKY